MNDICQSFGKKLIVRTFCYNRQEMNWILAGINDVSADVVITIKCQPADWNLYLPHNRLIEHFANQGRGFIVEYDLGEEYHGQAEFPYLCTEYQRYRLNHMLNQQGKLPEDAASGAVARIERYGSSALGRLNELNLRVFSSIMAKPDVDEQAVVDAVLQEHFHNWGPRVKQLLAETFDITNGVVYPWRSVWGFMMHMAVADYMYIYDSLANWPQIDEWVDDDYVNGVAALLLGGDKEAHAQTLANLKRTELKLEAVLVEMAKLFAEMPVELRVIIAEGFRKLEAFVRINVAHHRTFLALRRWENDQSQERKKEAVYCFGQFKKQVALHGVVLTCMRTEGVFSGLLWPLRP